MAQDVINNNLFVSGALTCGQFTAPAGSIGDSAIQAGTNIAAAKLQHQYEPAYANAASNGNAVADQRPIHVAKGATGTIVAFEAGAVVPLTGADTCTVDLWKNGASILTAPISLASTDTARTLKAAAGFTSTSYVAGDFFEVKVTPNHSTGTLPQGVTARLTVQEAAQ